jgi:hypothetical protein
MSGSRTPRRPSHSTVIAYLALFVALGGTAYALGVNSVKSKHIKNGAVRSVDVGNDRLTGTDVDESTLSGVDAASLGGTAVEDVLVRGQAHSSSSAATS